MQNRSVKRDYRAWALCVSYASDVICMCVSNEREGMEEHTRYIVDSGYIGRMGLQEGGWVPGVLNLLHLVKPMNSPPTPKTVYMLKYNIWLGQNPLLLKYSYQNI